MRLFDKRFSLIGLMLAMAASVALAQGNNTSSNAATGDTSMSKSDKAPQGMDKSVSILFKKGQSDLSAAEKQKLKSFIDAAKSRGDIDNIELAVWSDKAAPRVEKDLPKADVDLADKRIDNLKSFLKDQDVSVKTYNMAEHSNWLARAFRTDTAELHSMFSKEGPDKAPITRDDFNLIKDGGAASKAVLVATYKGDKSNKDTSESQRTSSDYSNTAEPNK